MKPLDRSGVISQSISVFLHGAFGIMFLMATILIVGTIFTSEILQRSVSVLFCWVVGLMPLIGLVSAVSAIIHGIRIRRAYADSNPANNYRKWGMALGGLGVLLNFCAVAIAIARLFAIANRGYWIDLG